MLRVAGIAKSLLSLSLLHALTLAAHADQYTAYVVDQPAQANEFASLEQAASDVCAHGQGRVVVKKRLPLALSNLTLGCDIAVESTSGANSEIISVRQDEPVTIESIKSLRWTGFQFSIPAGVEFRSQGDLELKDNAFLRPLTVISTGGVRFDSNQITEAKLKVEASSRPVLITSNSTPSGGGGRLALDLGSRLSANELTLFQVFNNTVGTLDVKLCSAGAATLNLDANYISEAKIGATSPATKMRVGDGRIGKLAIGLASCGNVAESPRLEIEVLRIAIDRLEAVQKDNAGGALQLTMADGTQVPRFAMNWHDGSGRSEVAVIARGVKFAEEFSWDTTGRARLDFENVEVGPNATISNAGSAHADLKSVRWLKGLTFHALDASASVGESLSVTQIGGFSGGGYEILANHRGPVSARLLGLELAPGARVSIDRSAAAAASPHNRAQEGRVEVRDMQFLKPGNSLQVSGIDGHVVIDNNRFNLEVSDFGFSGAKLARQSAGSTVVTRNEFVVGTNCPQKCAGLRAQELSNLLLQANKFYVYGKYANALDAQGVSATLKENEIRGSGLYTPLIQVTSSSARFSTIQASANVIDANGATAVQLAGETFASFTGNKFTGNGALNDTPGLDLAARGGLVENPISNNEGLHDKNVSTAVDFDGNGCRDIPRESNERLSDGSCRVAGKPKPSFP